MKVITKKICRKCGQEKELSLFHRKQDSSDGYRSRCKECRKLDAKEEWKNLSTDKKNSQRIRRNMQRQELHKQGLCIICGDPSETYYCRGCKIERNKRRQEGADNLKSIIVNSKGSCCYICGKSHHFSIYDFHHRDPKTKSATIASVIKHRTSIDNKLSKELGKCEIVCRNCHRVLHQEYKSNIVAHILQHEFKKMAVAYKGNICENCMESFSCLAVYDFHHINQKEKSYTITDLLKTAPKWNILKNELDKCQMLCANCHSAIHSIHNKNRYMEEENAEFRNNVNEK